MAKEELETRVKGFIREDAYRRIINKIEYGGTSYEFDPNRIRSDRNKLWIGINNIKILAKGTEDEVIPVETMEELQSRLKQKVEFTEDLIPGFYTVKLQEETYAKTSVVSLENIKGVGTQRWNYSDEDRKEEDRLESKYAAEVVYKEEGAVISKDADPEEIIRHLKEGKKLPTYTNHYYSRDLVKLFKRIFGGDWFEPPEAPWIISLEHSGILFYNHELRYDLDLWKKKVQYMKRLDYLKANPKKKPVKKGISASTITDIYYLAVHAFMHPRKGRMARMLSKREVNITKNGLRYWKKMYWRQGTDHPLNEFFCATYSKPYCDEKLTRKSDYFRRIYKMFILMKNYSAYDDYINSPTVAKHWIQNDKEVMSVQPRMSLHNKKGTYGNFVFDRQGAVVLRYYRLFLRKHFMELLEK